MVSSAVYPGLERKPGGPDNWVERAGGLPKYIERIAKHLHYEKGMSISRAIATAVNTVKRWARMGKVAKYGDPHHKHVSPKTAALAAAAVASWEAKRAAGRIHLSEETFRLIDLADEVKPHLRPQKCKYCSDPATKSILHAEGMAYIPVCGMHLAQGTRDAEHSTPDGTRDPSNIDKVYDLSVPQTSVDIGPSAILLADIIDLAGSDVDLQQLAERTGTITDPAAKAIARATLIDLAGPPTKVRKQLAKRGKAMPNGGFPIRNVEDLKNAIRAIGRAKDPAATKRYIKRRAKALGAMNLIPGGWSMDFSEPIDMSSSIKPRTARGRAKDGRPSFKRQGKWGHGFVPLDDAAKEAKAKGSPIAMRRMNRLFQTGLRTQGTGRAGDRSAHGRKENAKEIQVSPGKKGPTERASSISRLQRTKFEDQVHTRTPRPNNLKETSKQTRIPKRATQNWDEIPDNLKTIRNGKKYVLAEFGGKQVITEWVGGVRKQDTSNPKAKVMRTITAADAAKLSPTVLKAMLANPRTPKSIRKALNKALQNQIKQVQGKAS